jgi:hypothetical protein
VEECPDDEDFEEEAIDDYTLSDEELEGGTLMLTATVSSFPLAL